MPRPPKADPELHVYNPIFSRKNAAEYLGRSGRTLDRLNLHRDPMPGTGKSVEMGYRLATLNAYLASLSDPTSRTKKVRTAPKLPRRASGDFARRES